MKLDLLLYCSRPNVQGTLIKIPRNIPTSVYAKLTYYKIQMIALFGIIHAISIVWMWYLVKLQWFLINTVCFWQCIKCIKYYTIRFQAYILLSIILRKLVINLPSFDALLLSDPLAFKYHLLNNQTKIYYAS